jgi:hypothetical protein
MSCGGYFPIFFLTLVDFGVFLLQLTNYQQGAGAENRTPTSALGRPRATFTPHPRVAALKISQAWALIFSISTFLATVPTTCSFTCPSLKKSRVGML